MVVSLPADGIPPAEGMSVELRSERHRFTRTIERASVSGLTAIIALTDVAGIGEALAFVGCTLWGEAGASPAPGHDDVKGFRVFDREGTLWGTVRSQPRYSLNRLLEVADTASGEAILVPWHESLIVKIDRQAGILVIDPPPGLRELNR